MNGRTKGGLTEVTSLLRSRRVTDLEPAMTEVDFPWGLATRLYAEFRGAASQLDLQIPRRNSMATHAKEDWRGAYSRSDVGQGGWGSAQGSAACPRAVALTTDDLTQTVLFRLARTKLGALGGDGADRVEQLAHSVRQDTDPELRAHYGLAVVISWVRLTYWCTVALVAIGFLIRWTLGPAAADIFLAILMAVGFFFFAGSVNALWRYYWFVGQARRWARRDGPGSARFAASMHRTLPRDSSRIGQVVAGVLAFVITLAVT